MVGVDIAQQIRDNLSTEPNDGGFKLKELRDKLGDEFYEVFPEKKTKQFRQNAEFTEKIVSSVIQIVNKGEFLVHSPSKVGAFRKNA
ncbi:MAG: hypothetical protein PUG89_10635 [Succinivibrio sp.]|nr:hypothetical protein [Succinivibrio sp.]